MPAIEKKVGDLEFCALDLETTGTSPFTERIVEVGLVRFTINGIVEEYSTLVDPLIPIPPVVQLIHGISDEMVKGMPVMEDVIPTIERFIAKSELVIQNPTFDISFLEMEYLRAKTHARFPRAFDTVTIARKAFPGLPNYKLGTVSSFLGVDGANHRALGDAKACMSVFLRALSVFKIGPDSPAGDILKFAGDVTTGRLIEHINEKRCRGGLVVVGKSVIIDYLDKSGSRTERKILPKKIFKKGRNTVIQAYCYLREEERIFQASRIQNVRYE